MTYLNGVYALTEDSLLLLGRPIEVPEGSTQEDAPESMAEFGAITMDNFDSKYPVRLRLRLAAEEGVTVSAQLQYDSSGEWETAETIQVRKMTAFYLSIPVQRCDHFQIRLVANGAWRLWSMIVEFYDGAYVRK